VRALKPLPRIILVVLLLSLALEKVIAGPLIQPIWQFKQGSQPFYKAPIIHQDKVIFLSGDNDVVSISTNTGQITWRTIEESGIWEQSISTGIDQTYYGAKNKKICALQSTTGEKKWCTNLEKNMQKPPVEYGQRLYVVTAELGPGLHGDKTKGGSIYSIDKNSGKILWGIDTNNYAMQTPTIKDDVLYVAGSYHDPKIDVEEGGAVSITAININNLQTKWRYLSEDGFIKSLYLDGEFLAFIGYQDFVSVLNTGDGKLLWRKDTGNWVPKISGFEDVIYYGAANTNVHAWNIENGNELWRYNIGGESFNYALGAPIRINNKLIFLSQRGWLSILDATNGELLLQQKLDISSHIGLNANRDLGVIGDSEGVLHAYSMNNFF